MRLSIGEGILFGALVLSLLGFVASYNKALGEYEGRVSAMAEQAATLEHRVQVIERERCKP